MEKQTVQNFIDAKADIAEIRRIINEFKYSPDFSQIWKDTILYTMDSAAQFIESNLVILSQKLSEPS